MNPAVVTSTAIPLAVVAAGCLAVGAASFCATWAVLRLLRRLAILDHPNLRSSHVAATPRGGGLAVVPVVLAAWLGVAAATGMLGETTPIVACAFALAAISWVDDVKDLPASVRFGAQLAAVLLVMAISPAAGPYFGGWLPGSLDVAAAGLIWLWFINAFNFMDGIDGIAGTETACIGIGVALVAALAVGLAGETGAPAAGLGWKPTALFGATIAAAAIGFLPWNWHPARLFLGDVGSIALGFLLGWLLLRLAAEGQWAAALILPLYYFVDATLTLARRTWRGEKPWQAHREHYYQRAVASGLSHAAVARAVGLANVALIALAGMAATGREVLAIAGACLVVTSLLMFLTGGRHRQQPAPGNE
jgi:UDP-N-acetylmuramyl pentapeptide phosphotransferase/UDP-N-acetylglucosamine-1-phosphate transferase